MGRALRATLRDRPRGDGRRLHRPRHDRAGDATPGALEPCAAAGGEGGYRADEATTGEEDRQRRVPGVMIEAKTLDVGDSAPDFTLKTVGLKEVSLHDYKGKNVVLLFYPLDWTPG